MSPQENPIQTARGMHDVLPAQSGGFPALEAKARDVFARYGYGEIRTPVLEPVELFQRALGEATDVVEKEMFTLKDRGERTLCLRPEGTAGVVRAYIEHSLDRQGTLVKLFYAGPMFRAERPQAGRFREFVQIGSEYFGNAAPAADAETIQLAGAVLAEAGLPDFELRLNSIGCPACRPAYQKNLLEFLKQKRSALCENCKRRMEKNPLRALDCKEDREKLKEAPKPADTLCDPCAAHHKSLLAFLDAAGTAYSVDPSIVRGLDYYTRTVFEIYPSGKSGAQDALAAGGRYDSLVKQLGGPDVPAVGFALGVERVLNQLSAAAPDASEPHHKPGVFVAALGESALLPAFKILSDLRRAGLRADGALNGQSLKSQMRLADGLGMRFCLILGEDEIRENAVTLKDLRAKEQKKIPAAELIAVLKEASR